jgi:heat shock protein HtpX
MNTFVYFIAMWVQRLFAERDQYMLGFVVSLVLQVVLGFLAMIVVGWFSRSREFEADRFSGKAYGPAPMISALQGISRFAEQAEAQNAFADPLATMKISGDTGRWMRLFATHPPIEERIAALQRLA